MVSTDEMEQMVAQITNGSKKPKLDAERSKLWDQLKSEIDAMPKGAIVETGSEGMPHDLTNLYSK